MAQQQSQQPSNKANLTFEEQQIQSTTFVNPSNSSASSPRRRNAPLDLDAALYLQSQASYVQQPNRQPVSPLSASSNVALPDGSINTTAAATLGCTAGNNGCNNSNRTPLHSPSANKSAQLSGGSGGDTSYDKFFPTPIYRSAPLRSNQTGQQFYRSPNYYNNNNNISVDYIDCISNHDLINNASLQSQRPPHLQPYSEQSASTGQLRNMLHCRKHFRFHRNRVDPELKVATTSANESNLLEATSSSANIHMLEAGSNMTNSSSGDTSNTQATDSVNNMAVCSSNANDPNNTNNVPSSSCLYPISISEAKKRTYILGSVTQESLLGPDELYRYFPNGRVSIFVCTWNQNRKRAPMNLDDLLLPDQLVYMPEIYAIGIQEAFSSQNEYLRDWEVELQTTLGPNHVLLHSCSLGVLHLSLFVRRDLIWFCSVPEESVYNSRSMPTNMIKTKGAVSIAFRFFGTSFMFTNCHFPAHENKVKDRIDEYQRIINSIDLPKNLKLLKPRYLSNDSTARFDCVFFMGDLNFRLEQRTFDETIHILEDIFQQREPSYEALTQNDELLKVMETNQAFHGFDEPQIKFPPTYKFLAQTNKYDKQTKRVPSYTDRILFRSKRQRHIQCLIYDWLPQLLSSDHKPVYSLFEVLVRPGHEQNMVSTLNAGLFQRSVYLEALKRHAQDPDALRENGAGGNVICSIS